MNVVTFLRGTYGTLVAKVLVLVFLLISSYNFMSFSQSTRDAVDRSFSDSAQVDMYGLTDQLADPSKFDEYRQSTANIDKVASFYDALQHNDNPKVQLLSAFDQAMPVADFDGSEKFEHGYGTGGTTQGSYEDPILQRSVVNVKSVQMNQATFDFYNLDAGGDAAIDWGAVDYSSGSVPVLLGANYEGVYAVGDQLTVDYYSKPTQMTVAGFLPPDASMFYQGNINFFLDDYLLVPYPDSIEGAPAADKTFYGILAFAMLNANIAVAQDQPDDTVVRALESAATSSGFDQYALLNVPTYLTQFAAVRALVQENFGLVLTVELLITCAALVMSAVLTLSADRRRERRVRVFWELGFGRRTLNRTVLAISALEYVAVVAVFIVITQTLPNEDGSARTLLLGAAVSLFIVDAVLRQGRLQRTIRYRPRSES